MSQKPSDFFIGVVDFFAILLPGVVLGYLFYSWRVINIDELFSLLSSPTSQWIAFGVSAYILGHILHHLGGVLDWLYDSLYVQKYKRRDGEERLLTKTREIMRKSLGTDVEMTSAYSWAGSYVRVMSDAAGQELDRAGADSKFFRSLALVSIIAIPIFITNGSPLISAFALILMIFSIWRFSDRRWKAAQLTYEYFILLSVVKPHTEQASKLSAIENTGVLDKTREDNESI